MKTSSETQYRYPGLQPFRVKDEPLFYGREREKNDLHALVMVEKMVVLFSKSGMGKSSLLNAGLTPMLEKTNLLPLDIRLNDLSLPLEQQFLRELEKKSETVTLSPNLNRKEATLWEQVKFARFTRNGEEVAPLFIFDQFEEIFTLYNYGQRRRFLEELADLANGNTPVKYSQRLRQRVESVEELKGQDIIELDRSPRVKFIFSIRSDLLHLLNNLSPLIPDIMRSRFELQPLTREQAEEAIVLPAMLRAPEGTFVSPMFQYDEDALTTILDHLTKKGQEDVESFQLQILCQYIERLAIQQQKQTAPGKRVTVTDYLFGGNEGIAAILKNFYTDQIAKLPKEQQAISRVIIEETLITENERRRSVDEDQLLKRGATPDLLDRFVEMRLLRKEPRLKTFYYEISHDTLVPPILVKYRERKEEQDRLDALRKAKEAEETAREEKKKRQEAERLQREAEQARAEAEQQKAIAEQQKEEAERLQREAEAQKHLAEQARAEAERQQQIAERSRRRTLVFSWISAAVTMMVVAVGIYAFYQDRKLREAQLTNARVEVKQLLQRGDDLKREEFHSSALQMYRAAASIIEIYPDTAFQIEKAELSIKIDSCKLKTGEKQ